MPAARDPKTGRFIKATVAAAPKVEVDTPKTVSVQESDWKRSVKLRFAVYSVIVVLAVATYFLHN